MKNKEDELNKMNDLSGALKAARMQLLLGKICQSVVKLTPGDYCELNDQGLAKAYLYLADNEEALTKFLAVCNLAFAEGSRKEVSQ